MFITFNNSSQKYTTKYHMTWKKIIEICLHALGVQNVRILLIMMAYLYNY